MPKYAPISSTWLRFIPEENKDKFIELYNLTEPEVVRVLKLILEEKINNNRIITMEDLEKPNTYERTIFMSGYVNALQEVISLLPKGEIRDKYKG